VPAPADLPALPITFRPRRTRAVLLSMGTILLVVFVTVGLLLPSEGETGWSPGDRVAFLATGALICAVLAVLARPRVVAEQDGVTVVNLTVKRRLAWAELVRVNLRQGDPWVYLDLADGTSLAAMGIQQGIGRAQAVEAALCLRRLVDAHTAHLPGTPGRTDTA
jgi:Bacterial PH domain